MSIDIKDIKILYLLTQDSRMPYSKIGKKTQLSGDSIKSRIEKLKRSNIIKSFKVNVNFKILGFFEYDVYFRFKNYNSEELEEIIIYLKNSKYVTWIGTCFGKYDLRVSIIVRKISDVNEFIVDMEKIFSKYLVDYILVQILEKYKIDQKSIISNMFNIDYSKLDSCMLEKRNAKNPDKILIQLNEADKKLIKSLNENTQVSLVELSFILSMTPEAINYRIKELFKKDVLRSFSMTINGNRLNKIWAVFLFRFSSKDSKKLYKFIGSLKNVSSFVHLIGGWDFSVSIFANNVQEIHNTLMGFRNSFPDLIKDYDLILLFETFKYPTIPDIIFE